MNKKTLVYALALLIVAGSVGVISASARGFGSSFAGQVKGEKAGNEVSHEARLEAKAEVLGLTQVELQAKLDQGLKYKEIAQEQGVDLESRKHNNWDQNVERLKNFIHELEANGKISVEQARQLIVKIDVAVEEENHKLLRHIAHWLKITSRLFE
jgi:ribosomal protein L13E